MWIESELYKVLLLIFTSIKGERLSLPECGEGGSLLLYAPFD